MLDNSTKDRFWRLVKENRDHPECTFFYGVKTTKIFCRPSCPSRLPKKENVCYFSTAAEAQAQGFRACKRCQPTDEHSHPHAVQIATACRHMESQGGPVKTEVLARDAQLSSSQFHRIFKSLVGLTPRQYGIEVRRGAVRSELTKKQSITQSTQQARYSSSGHFHQESKETIGMKASSYSRGGVDQVIRFTMKECPLGWLLLATTELGVCALHLGDDPAMLEASFRAQFHQAEIEAESARFEPWLSTILNGLSQAQNLAHIPLDLRGTVFQKRVWQALRNIPQGEVLSYSELARSLDQPKAYRAVASACAQNQIALLVPCHRVLGKNGKLTGYRWGLERKKHLLQQEGAFQEL